MKVVVITGVSTGIGYDAARALCRLGYKVHGSVRLARDAERVAAELGPNFTPLVLDVTDRAAIDAAADQVAREVGVEGVAGLVNNAGISEPGPLSLLSPDVVRRHFEVNVIGPLHMTQAFLPLLRANKSAGKPAGRIVNISSVSGRIGYPFMGPYAASKHALEGLSDSLRRELTIYGVDVIVVQPGSINTPIWAKAAHVRTAFQDTDYAKALQDLDIELHGREALPIAPVTRKIIEALTVRRPKSRYLVPDRWIMAWFLPRYLPDRWLDRLIAWRLKLNQIRNELE